ncbi:unnamed protein product [Cuscuta europaea]|uniref:Protein kinase domain-containing protein n=1 Tax=Cuscuta europaea TaxID=41803 RepID=A0A9P1EM29_CUSEU|nr:unnamed protein product [Cuscuta europaea]
MEGLNSFCLFALLWWGYFLSQGSATIENDKHALLEFLKKLPHSRVLNWDENLPVCKNWTGVSCNGDGSRVTGLRLPGVGLQGPIPNNTLNRLSALQTLSLRSNGISGGFPLEFTSMKNLSYLYLQHNNFSGPLPVDFSVWKNLTAVDLSNNEFNGSIPYSVSGLKRLTSLNLANNSISGEIADFHLPMLQLLNLSYNHLTGSVPKSLQRFPESVFAGNYNVSYFNFSTVSCSPSIRPYQTALNKSQHNVVRKLSEKALLGSGVAVSVVAILGFSLVLIVCCIRRKSDSRESRFIMKKYEKGQWGRGRDEKSILSLGKEANNSLVFFEGCNYAYDLEDLFRASAEVLGKGTFGMAYKATLEEGTTVVVKRLKEVEVGIKEFQHQMELVGSIKHENVVELRAYYYSKDEKLIVCDYFPQGSIAAMLHGNMGESPTTPLDWETRVKIAVGSARGIAQIHAANGGKLAHGNLKSSNVFLNLNRYGCVSDTGMSRIMGSLSPSLARAAGYRAPEVVMDTRKATQPSDVFSFGVLLLELLTGKSPVVHTTASGDDEVIHLVRWVHSVVREQWTGEVFDMELLKFQNIEEEMVEMLQIALSCVVRVPDQRPKMPDVVKMVESVRLLLD